MEISKTEPTGKYYVLEDDATFDGPFDTQEEAEKEVRVARAYVVFLDQPPFSDHHSLPE